MMYLLAALTFAALTAFATWKQNRRLEFIAKPAVMIALIVYLWTSVGLRGALTWFALGMVFSLVGDVLLLWLDRMFLHGLVAFLLAQIFYVIGFNSPPSPFSMWGIIMAVIVGLGAARVLRRLLSALTGEKARMRTPVAIYSVVITLMLLSAMLKLTDAAWGAGASGLVGLGAFLFYLSDIVLAWLKFVAPIQNGRIINIGLYHLGQICIAAGVALQFS